MSDSKKTLPNPEFSSEESSNSSESASSRSRSSSVTSAGSAGLSNVKFSKAHIKGGQDFVDNEFAEKVWLEFRKLTIIKFENQASKWKQDLKNFKDEYQTIIKQVHSGPVANMASFNWKALDSDLYRHEKNIGLLLDKKQGGLALRKILESNAALEDGLVSTLIEEYRIHYLGDQAADTTLANIDVLTNRDYTQNNLLHIIAKTIAQNYDRSGLVGAAEWKVYTSIKTSFPNFKNEVNALAEEPSDILADVGLTEGDVGERFYYAESE